MGDKMSLLKLLALPFVAVSATVIDWLFPNESEGYIHHEGHFMAGDKGWKSWDDLTPEERLVLQERGG